MVACATSACCSQLLWSSSLEDNIYACKMALRHCIALQSMMPLLLFASRQALL